ncbi:hypothetical protein BpHYR1_033835 [Brachionus plicatilis]|uniref:Uncharacterized protein n=1 Tax=Brachionus plicatilis TaxID=10195 RepID=A0A3M7PUD6_BRAPC|nr:hypothetical protein BpHYR1_033835 [Brachionus plicatilis]
MKIRFFKIFKIFFDLLTLPLVRILPFLFFDIPLLSSHNSRAFLTKDLDILNDFFLISKTLSKNPRNRNYWCIKKIEHFLKNKRFFR